VISIFPNDTETFVLPGGRDEILEQISKELNKPFRGFTGQNLTGWIEDSKFRLTIQLRRQHAFMPVVAGWIEKTSKGTIVFVQYSLFPGTRLLLLFWTVVLPLTAAFLSDRYQNYWVLGGAILFIVFIYSIAWANFKLHVKTTRAVLHRILNVSL
jgi:hypothetical protein